MNGKDDIYIGFNEECDICHKQDCTHLRAKAFIKAQPIRDEKAFMNRYQRMLRDYPKCNNLDCVHNSTRSISFTCLGKCKQCEQNIVGCECPLPPPPLTMFANYCPHMCSPANCITCKEAFVQNAAIQLYAKWWLDGREGENLEWFRKYCWEQAEGLWKARF